MILGIVFDVYGTLLDSKFLWPSIAERDWG